jgi:hypothetical protein
VLKAHLDSEGYWSKQRKAEMAKLVGVKYSQVYKFHWDQQEKNRKGVEKKDYQF